MPIICLVRHILTQRYLFKPPFATIAKVIKTFSNLVFLPILRYDIFEPLLMICATGATLSQIEPLLEEKYPDSY